MILTTDDSPYEEELHILLLDKNLVTVDQIDIGLPYQPGILGDLEIYKENGLTFTFYNNVRFKLIIDKGGEYFSFRHTLPGVKYRKSFINKRYLNLFII